MIGRYNRGEIDILILPEVGTEYSAQLSDAEKKFLFKEFMWLVGTCKDTDMPKQIDVAEYTRYPIILFTGEYPHFNQSLQKVLDAAKVDLQPTFESTNVGTLKRVIESGLGWGFLPSLAIKKQVRMGRLNHVLMRGFDYEVEFFFYSKKSAELKSITEVFYQALQQQERA